MIQKRLRYGNQYDYDDNKQRYFNPITKKWVKKIRPSSKGKAKGKAISKIETPEHFYYDFQINELNSQSKPTVHYSPERLERINFFLSKVERKYQARNWIKNNNDSDLDIKNDEKVIYFSTIELKYLLTAEKRDEIIKTLTDNDLVKLNKKEKKSHWIDGHSITFINPKFYWFFTPTKNLLSREKKLKAITYKRVNNSVNNYFKIIESKLGDYSSYYRNMYKCKFNITRDEFDQVIKSKYEEKKLKRLKEAKPMKCSFDEYVKSSNYLYETIQEWNLGNKYSNLSSFKVDSFSGRVHSIFSQLSKDFFKFNDTFNVEIDLATSQPVMLAHILKSEIGENQFSNDVDNGMDIYEKIKNHYSLPDRDAGKQMFYELIFGHKSNLDELYPEANQWIKEKKDFDLYTYRYKSDTPECRLINFYNKKGKYVRRYSIIALMLQELELKIFKKIWEVLNTVGIAFVTRHDSVVINPNDLENATYHINNILEEELCVNGRLKVKKLMKNLPD